MSLSRRDVRASFFVFASLLLWATAPAVAQRPLDLSFDEGALLVADLEPGATVVVTTVERSSRGYVPYNERHDHWLVDDDQDGAVRITLEEGVSRKFVAIAVELASGRFDVWTPEGSPARSVALPATSLQEGPSQRLDRLEEGRDYVELLAVRPGVGAWGLTTGDGTPHDESPASDGTTLTALASLRPIGESGPPPEEYERDDLLVRVAPREMEYYAVRIVR